jgi:hypothetical protein
MSVSFLDITPKPSSETLSLQSEHGPVELEFRGVSLSTLAEIAKKHPAFGRVMEGGAGSIIDATDAMPCLIAAGLGHPGDQEYEQKVREFPTRDIMAMATCVIRLTFPQAAAGPLPAADPASANGGADAPPVPISQPRSSS